MPITDAAEQAAQRALDRMMDGARAAVFIDHQRVSDWVPVGPGGNAVRMVLRLGGMDPWLRVVSATGDLIWSGRILPGVYTIAAAMDEIVFDGFELTMGQFDNFAVEVSRDLSRYPDTLLLDDIDLAESAPTITADAPDPKLKQLLTGWPFEWSPPAVAYPYGAEDYG